jgi:predicted XRE-type DNA-binding protein
MRVDMCNLGEILELEAIKSERVRNIKSIMTKLKMSFKEAIAFLEIPEDEVLELVSKKNADQPEFLQAVTEVLNSLRLFCNV